ncbi:hypothetical protein [Leptospira barantonii]|uniref:Lipoprotein n=1 Tax=Leptospira barantonii TaxID=2023184 RepID=A0ABX4NJB4_9LEPT|nr:hypothetical protein [Leptospira barantonii]PJZ56850.1 hypothetical protein CH367_12145 [Leptospira barantonii]
MNHKIIIFFCILCFNFCAGFTNPPEVIQNAHSFSKGKKFRLEFTGFTLYNAEMLHIKKNLLEKGISEDEQSEELLEVILEEQEPFYSYNKLHVLNFFASLLTFGVIPYYNKTEHTIVYRLSEKGKRPKETVHHLVLDQWRGFLILPLSPFYWPSSSFEKTLLDSIQEFEK